jgi:alkylation response protein AidB-like acyl-CoA dehydrogenase
MKKTNTDLHIIDWLLSSGISVEHDAYPDFTAFRRAFYTTAGSWEAPVDRAIAGGFAADCFAYAFAAGYCCALQRLVPTLPQNIVACFCITEEGGGHPRAIQSRLVSSGSDANGRRTFILTGHKKYITCAAEADRFLVAASEGIRDDGKNSIRMITIDARAPGIRIMPMQDLRLVPEISHAAVAFTDVAVSEADLLPGDGYTDYIRPFRTIEDLHVSAAVLGYLFRNACQYGWDRSIRGSILGRIVSVRCLAASRPDAPAVHIVMGDALNRIKELFERLEPLWETVGGTAKQAWDRDKALMNIADKARAMRLQSAWNFYGEPPLD